jgi:hypothetical protein
MSSKVSDVSKSSKSEYADLLISGFGEREGDLSFLLSEARRFSLEKKVQN